jgi:hypothetical protein
LGLCLAAHLVIRFALPHADPYLFPLTAVLASVGIVMVYRIDPVLARQQAQWMVFGLVLFAATILALRRRGGCSEEQQHPAAGQSHLLHGRQLHRRQPVQEKPRPAPRRPP